MGMNEVPLKDLTPDEPKLMTLELIKKKDTNDAQNNKSRGQLVVELIYKPFKEEELPKTFQQSKTLLVRAPDNTPDGGGMLVVIVHEAEDVEGKHHNNPYVRILFRGEKRKTKVCYLYPNSSIKSIVYTYKRNGECTLRGHFIVGTLSN